LLTELTHATQLTILALPNSTNYEVALDALIIKLMRTF
jgi:hypothetical protein